MAREATVRPSPMWRYRNIPLGGLAVVLFFPPWQALFLVVPFNPLFISKPSLIFWGFVDLVQSGELPDDLTVSAVPFFLGLGAAVVVGVPLGIVMGWRGRGGYPVEPLSASFYLCPPWGAGPLPVLF